MTERRCVGCWQVKNRQEFIKITADSATSNVVVNPDSVTFGRSAYLCYNKNCIEQKKKKNKLNKALKSSEDLKGLLDGRKY